jgi:two-component system, NarL family, nitrate/nitrite response regulator NarL
VKVLICDDHPIVAGALAATLERLFNAEALLVHSFAKAREVLAAGPEIGLCVMDLHIPGEDAHSNLRALRDLLGATPILVFSGSSDDADLRMTLELGLNGFLSKSAPPEVVEAAVRLVLAGGRYLPERVADLALQTATSGRAVPEPAPRSEADGHGRLTPRQQRVLNLMALGHPNKVIAQDLGISPATVKVHVAQVIAVLGASNRTEAVARARHLGLL